MTIEAGGRRGRIGVGQLVGLMAVVGILALATHANAITYGTVDTVHTYVGALIGLAPNLFDPSFPYQVCSGSLVSPTVFLTAGHCIAHFQNEGLPLDKIFVSFAANFVQEPKSFRSVAALVLDTLYDPSIPPSPVDNHDIGLVILAKAVKDVATAKLAPVAGYLDELMAAGKLSGYAFATVGYGRDENFQLSGDRKIAYSGFVALFGAYLYTSENPALGFGGGCISDSGAPKLFNDGVNEYIVATDNWGDAACQSADNAYRMDTAESLAFILGGIAANP